MTRQTQAELTIIPELDGVRGVAILLVLGFHFGRILPQSGRALLGLGWAGVDLFFVLSGYLITRILWTTRENRSYFSSFYGRRILRIFPVAFAYLAAYFWIALPLAHHFGYDLDRNGSDQLWYWAYLANWHYGLHGSLTHLWSLSIEEQFYLIWPTVVFATSLRNLQRLCIVLVVLPLGLRFLLMGVYHYSVLTQGMTVCRTEALALGALIALSKGIRVLPWLAVPSAVGVLAIDAAFGAQGRIMGIYGLTLIALACAGFVQRVVKGAGNASIWSRLLRSAWLRRFGKYSYAIYVLHIPILSLAFHVYSKAPSPLRGFALFFAGIALSYLAGWASWHFFESRILRLKRYFAYDRTGIQTKEAVATV
ncbi:MAG: acyltransferase family protein [Candidatus Sulfotelmatobacter sp.]